MRYNISTMFYKWILIIAPVFILPIGIALGLMMRSNMNKRAKALACWARSHNLSFSAAKDKEIEYRYPRVKLLQRGDNQYGYNVMEGDVGNRKICAFDYYCYGWQDKTQRFSVVVLDTGISLKPLLIRVIRGATFHDKLEDLDGGVNIELESTEFNSIFHVKSPDKKWAYDVLSQGTMELLMTSPRFNIDFQNRYIIASRDSLFEISDFEAAMAVVTGILDRLPASVIQELKEIKQYSYHARQG
jgi:hypothetical protein